ncbi:MAG: HAMP domain-containing sensor histidine kinase [Myxococcota bacterium]
MFRRAIAASAGFLVVALGILWASTSLGLFLLDREARSAIENELAWQKSLLASGGMAAVESDLTVDGQAVWESDWVYGLLDEGEFVHAVVDRRGELRAGFGGLSANRGWSYVFLEHEINRPLLAHRSALDQTHDIVIARFRVDEEFVLRELRWVGSAFLFLIVLPLSLVTGYVLSRGVFVRLSSISETAETVAQGEVGQRVPLSKRRDEFDRLSMAMNRMLDRLEALHRSIKDVSVGIAHDLRTPVSTLGGRLQLLEHDAEEAALVRKHVTIANENVATILRTFDALLRLGEVEAGRRRAAFRRVDLSELVLDVCETFEPVLADAGIELIAHIADGVRLRGDGELLTQLLTNLLDNVVEHARGSERAWVTLSADDRSARLTVRDDGVGVPVELRGLIFERFFRLDASRETPGNGLGLSLVKAICELHDGEIRIAPSSVGTTLETLLPRASG